MRLLTAERPYPADPEEVWDALTNPERVPRWLGGGLSGDLTRGWPLRAGRFVRA